MGQAEIQTILMKEKRFFSTEELVQRLKGQSKRPAIVTSLKQMLKYKEVIKRDGDKGHFGRRKFYWMLK